MAEAKGKKALPKKIGGLPTPVVVVVGVAAVAYLYLRHSAAAQGVQAAGQGGTGGALRGPPGRIGPRGRPGRTILRRQVVLICPPGYHKGPSGRHCIPNAKRRPHPAHPKMRAQRG